MSNDEPELPPEKAAAKDRADSIASRREHPEFSVDRLRRPRAVTAGCIMAWVGCTVLMLAAFMVPAGVLALLALVLLVVSGAAFLGHKWAATGLVVLAAVCVVAAGVGLLTALSTWLLNAAIWSVVSASLVRYRESAREWYAALAEYRRLNSAG